MFSRATLLATRLRCGGGPRGLGLEEGNAEEEEEAAEEEEVVVVVVDTGGWWGKLALGLEVETVGT